MNHVEHLLKSLCVECEITTWRPPEIYICDYRPKKIIIKFLARHLEFGMELVKKSLLLTFYDNFLFTEN